MPEEYWTIDAEVEGSARRRSAPGGQLDGEKAEMTNEGEARAIVDEVAGAELRVGRRSRRRSGASTRRPRSSPRKLQQEAAQQAALLGQAHDGPGPAPVRRCRARRRGPDRSHHLHAYRLDAPLDDAITEVRAYITGRYGGDRARRAQRLQDQEAGAGRARGHPPDLDQFDPETVRQLMLASPAAAWPGRSRTWSSCTR